MATFNLDTIFSKAFGYSPPANKFKLDEAPDRLQTASLGGKYYATDLLGREFFMPVTIDGVLIPFAVVGINCRKKIVETDMPERGGSVNELISLEDYVINVKGIIINDDNNFPEGQIIEVHDLFLKNKSVQMQCVLTDIFLKGAYDQHVIIKGLNFPPVSGVEHAKPFELDLKSDMIFTLEID